MSQGDATRSHSATTLGKNDPRASDTLPIMQSFKRSRQHLEPGIPTIHVNEEDTLSSASTETVIHNYIPAPSNEPAPVGSNTRYLVSKLDRLHDKKERYSSHRQFLQKCLDNDIVPNGLRLDLEPTIGNHDEEFLQNWYSKLEEYSKNFMKDVLAFCVKTNAETDASIKALDTELQTAVEKAQYDNVQATIIQNNTLRSNELQRRKNKKFYALKFKKETPRPAPPSRRANEQQAAINNWRGDTSPSGHGGQRAPLHETPGNRTNTQGRTYAAIVEGRNFQQQNKPKRNRSHQDLSRSGSFNNFDNHNEPLHQQISLQRKRSFRNEDKKEQQLQSEIIKLQSQLSNMRNSDKADAPAAKSNNFKADAPGARGKGFVGSNKHSERANQHLQQPDSQRQSKVDAPGTSGNNFTSNNHFPYLNQKNENNTQNHDMGANNLIIQEAFTFVTGAMETLRNFETKFAALLNTHRTPSDRS